MLPDDVLMEIFDFRVAEDFRLFDREGIEGWQILAHVCQRWRSVVFQSPRRLNLQLLCTPKTPARDTLDIWPPLPLIIRDVINIFHNKPSRMDNIIAALERNDRVCDIKLNLGRLTSSQFGYITYSAAILKPFPELTDLHLGMYNDDRPEQILPDSFLGGTAPRLRSLKLEYVPFPGLPKLLLSTTYLVHLYLHDIPRSGHIPPNAMATGISALTNLESLHLQFRYPPPRPALESRLPPPLTRSILHSLTKIRFKGTSEYLEKILARIDAPQLHKLHITFFNQIIFDTPQLFQFVSQSPTLRASEKGHIRFGSKAVIIKFPSQTSDYDVLSLEILCTALEWQLSSLAQVCTSSLPPFSTSEDLYIFEDQRNSLCSQDDVERTLWLDLLRSFIAVKNLYLSEEIMRRIAPTLQELVGGNTTEVLPAVLENIFLEWIPSFGIHNKEIAKFAAAARRLTNHPIKVSRWDKTRGSRRS
jgi:hypothetical protein